MNERIFQITSINMMTAAIIFASFSISRSGNTICHFLCWSLEILQFDVVIETPPNVLKRTAAWLFGASCCTTNSNKPIYINKMFVFYSHGKWSQKDWHAFLFAAQSADEERESTQFYGIFRRLFGVPMDTNRRMIISLICFGLQHWNCRILLLRPLVYICIFWLSCCDNTVKSNSNTALEG